VVKERLGVGLRVGLEVDSICRMDNSCCSDCCHRVDVVVVDVVGFVVVVVLLFRVMRVQNH